MKNNFGGFFLLFGLAFAGIPVFAIVAMSMSEEGIDFGVIPFLCIFIAVGVTIFIMGLRSLIQGKKEKKVEKIGIFTTATFLEEKGIGSINDVPYYTFTFTYKNQNGEEVTGKTAASFTKNQLNYYKEKQTFKIKYYDNIATIVEKPYEHKAKSLNNANSNICPYCQSVIEKDKKKCPNCGASIKK